MPFRIIYFFYVKVLQIYQVILIFTDLNFEKPECLLRIEKLTNKTITFINCDITNINDLRNVFQKVKYIY